ncbi:type III-B CRISPR module RAMP protein Cmr6 [Anaerostipes sp.]|uniref:type III-B CRISPR module RAMP protein Cmr6 n=1 Tax=Anaerostipes sp. TaxID=1872530 RepID=UPI0025C52340|nr:type III-B CRISPR module RAMP protein Cmr6 [Anaerostipes sp.]MBS7007936.1 type III-B CRISPR module RAMP protein Cmr6 [Anaerostipes sp.]
MKKRSNLQYLFDVEYYKYLLDETKSEDHMKNCKNALIQSEFENTVSSYDELVEMDDIVSFRLKTCAPGLLIGIGNAHGTKGEKEDIQMGMSMDYVTGYPYIPGSAVKGIIRSAFQKFPEEICKWLGGEYENSKENLQKLEKNLFEPDSKKDFEEKDLFFDAYIVGTEQKEQKFIDTDNITPHIDKKNPAESIFKSPEAVTTMLKVRPDVIFEFRIRISGNGKIKNSERNRKELYQNLLCELGIGAKTNLGYGIVEPPSLDNSKKTKEEQNRKKLFEGKVKKNKKGDLQLGNGIIIRA